MVVKTMEMAQPMAPKKDYMCEVRERGCGLLMGSISSSGSEKVDLRRTWDCEGSVEVGNDCGGGGACLPAVHVGKESGIHGDGFGMRM